MKFFVQVFTGQVKSNSELKRMSMSKIKKIRQQVLAYVEPFEGIKLTRPAKRELSRKEFKAKYGGKLW